MEEKVAIAEARASLNYARISARKVKVVADLIRGKKVSDALGILANLNKSAAPVVAKLVKSAAANAVNNQKMDEASLYIKEIWVCPGKTLKRFMPRAMGRATMIRKRTSHIEVVVKEKK